VNDELDAGAEFRGYRVDSVLGRGRVSTVYRAVEIASGRAVALKIYHPAFSLVPMLREAFLEALRRFAEFEHRNVLPVYDAGEDEGALYVVEQIVDGRNLGELLQRERRLRVERALAILEQVAAGLDDAHERGVVHGDLKPANVLIDASEERALISDFFEDVATGPSSDAFIGTVAFAAPERLVADQVDPSADIFSFGCIAFLCLTGKEPFPDFGPRTGEVPRATALRPDLPIEVDDVFSRALAADPAQRHASCRALVEELRAVLTAEGLQAGPMIRTKGELQTQARRIFISYSSREQPAAAAVCAKLEASGFECWIAPRDIVAGAPWAASIIGGIDQSFALVVLLSAHALASQQVLREVSYAADRGLRIIPLRLEDVHPSGAMTYYLGPQQWLDACAGDLPELLDPLVAAVRAAATSRRSA
jgi:hypothetical protein